MFPGNNFGSPYGGGGPYRGRSRQQSASAYQYQYAPEQASQASSLVSKVMALMATSFLVATIGAFISAQVFTLGFGTVMFTAIGGLIVLFILQACINVRGLNLALLFLFVFLEGLGLGPLIQAYTYAGLTDILGQAFMITALTSLGLSVYAWTTKRNFSRLGDYLFFGLLLLIVAGFVGFFFNSIGFALLVSVFGVAIFCGYILFYIQRAKYMADTLPNAIGLTVSLFLTVLNLFLYILEILTILQGGRRRN